MSGMALIVAGVATWRIAVLIVDDEITAGLRNFLGRWAWTSYLVSCIACTSFWIGLVIVAGYYFWSQVVFWIVLPFALSGVAMLLERLGPRGPDGS